MKRIEKPWGFELVWAETAYYLGKVLHIRKGERLSYQYHQQKDESIYVARGLLELEYEMDGVRQCRRLAPGEAFRIPTGMRHRFIAVEETEVVEVSTPYPDDVVRLEDQYGRA